jgi:hypothetical protein
MQNLIQGERSAQEDIAEKEYPEVNECWSKVGGERKKKQFDWQDWRSRSALWHESLVSYPRENFLLLRCLGSALWCGLYRAGGILQTICFRHA